MAGDSALILVSPGDSVDTIIQKVRSAGAGSIELLVPDGTPALQALGGFARLRQSTERDRIGLLVISSDEKTLNAARLNQIDTMGVQGARVTLPASPGNGGETYATRRLGPDELDLPSGAPIAEQDAEFLNALDQVSAQNRYADLSDEDAEMFAALDDLSDAIQRSGPVRRGGDDEDSLGQALDDWDAATNEGRESHPSEDWDSAFGGEGGAARRRVRPEDIDVSDAEMRRQRGGLRSEALRERARAGVTPLVRDTGRRRRPTRSDLDLDLEEPEEAMPARQSAFLRLLPLLILLIIILLLAIFFLNNRATITVAPPLPSAGGKPFAGEVIPITPSATDTNAAALQALPVTADAVFTATGQVVSETLSPATTAKGIVTLINTIAQPIQVPADTELIGANPQGQEVRFTLDAPATVPPAVTSSSLTGTSTEYGRIDVGVTARSPGSASNIGENSIKQLLIPGQQPIVSDSSNFLIRNAPIGGGSDQPQRIVTNADVERVLGEALTGLYNAGVQSLRGTIDETKQGIDAVSVYPDPQTLGKSGNYDPPLVNPPVGQPVDPNNPNFSVTVRRAFTALATPRDRPVSQQLETVAPRHFSQLSTPPCKPSETQNTQVSGWHWDGRSLTVDAMITCTASGGLAPATLNQVRDAVRGRSRADAQAALEQLQQQGLIGGFTLQPGKDSFPNFDLLLDVEVARSAEAPAQPGATGQPAAPTQGAP